MLNRNLLTQFDYMLFGACLCLALLGALGVYSADIQSGGGSYYVRQLIWVGLGVVVCLILSTIDYHLFSDHAFLIYGFALILLLAILFFGTEVNGSRSWIYLGGIGFQPSEFVKIVIILVMACFLAERSENHLGGKQMVSLALVAFLPLSLVALQGDLGTALMYVPMVLGIMLVAGLRLRVLAGFLAIGLLLAPFGWYSLKEYQRQRIMVTLDPSLDPSGVGYQSRQSEIAIGSGGLTGKGMGNGMQSQLGFVPEIHTDFIFALLAEESGLVGAGLVLLLYGVVLFRMIAIAEQARDRAGILILTGIASALFSHIVVNIGMALGIIPPIGIPLPLLSYGGSSTLTMFCAIGLALSVYRRRFVYT